MFCSQASTLWFICFIGILSWCMYRKSKVEMNRLHWLWKWCNYSPLNCFIAIFTFTGLPIGSFLPELCKQYSCSCTDATLHLTLIKIRVYIFRIMQTILLLLLHWCHSASHTYQNTSLYLLNYPNNTASALTDANLHLTLIKIGVYIFRIVSGNTVW